MEREIFLREFLLTSTARLRLDLLLTGSLRTRIAFAFAILDMLPHLLRKMVLFG